MTLCIANINTNYKSTANHRLGTHSQTDPPKTSCLQPHLYDGSLSSPDLAAIIQVSGALAGMGGLKMQDLKMGDQNRLNTSKWSTKYQVMILGPSFSAPLPAPTVKNWRILSVQSFTAHMPLLAATSAFGLGRRRWSSPQQCYLHCLRKIYYYY